MDWRAAEEEKARDPVVRERAAERANIFGDEDVGVEDEGDGEERAERCKRA